MTGNDKELSAGKPAADPETPTETEEQKDFDDAFDEFSEQTSDDDTDAPIVAQRDIQDTKDDPQPSGDKRPEADEAAPDAAGKPDEPEDIWANATDEQKTAFDRSEQENRSHRGRVQSQDRKRRAYLQNVTQPEQVDPADAEKSKEEWEHFELEYPEVAGPVKNLIDNKDARIASLQGQVNGMAEGLTRDALQDQEALLLERHPDFVAATSTPEFHTWVREQPRYVQEGFARNGHAIVDGLEAASLIGQYKASRDADGDTDNDPDPSNGEDEPAPQPAPQTTDAKPTGLEKRRGRRLNSAVKTGSTLPGPGSGPPEGDFDAAFDHFANQPDPN